MRMPSIPLSAALLLCSAAAPYPTQPSPAEIDASIRRYQALTKEFTARLARSPSPKQIEADLTWSLRPEVWKTRPDTNTLTAVLTNLYLLEQGLRETAPVTKSALKPPHFQTRPSGAPMDVVQDPAERAEVLAYAEARHVLAELWNRHQELQAEHLRHGRDAISRVAVFYLSRSDRAPELRAWLLPYAGYEFARELSRQLPKSR